MADRGMDRWKDFDFHTRKPVLWIVGIYAVFGCLWIIFSDAVLAWMIANPALITRFQTAKGLLFIFVTAVLLYGLIRWHLRRYQQAEHARRESERQLLGEVVERRQTEASLRESREQLRRKSEQLLETDKRKDEFLAMLAHELRNPLAPMRATLELIRRHQPAPDEPMDRWLAVLNRQVSHLTRMIDDLLDSARISRGRIELQWAWVNLRSCVDQAVEMNKPLIAAQGTRLTVTLEDEPLQLWADPVRITQILFNLLNNALKYTPARGQVSLSARRESGQIFIEVRDNGMGMPSDVLPNIFDTFYQADKSLDRQKGGLGLGLTLVKKLVDLHRGTVEASSPGIGQGSTFAVCLPVGEEHARAGNASSPQL